MSEPGNRNHEAQLDPIAQSALFRHYEVSDITANDIRPDAWGLPGPAEFTPETQRAYPFTTENMAGYMDELDLDGKDIAAVCGSNDFALNAFLKGARSVDAVDVMQTACLYAELKTAGLLTLSRGEFLSFFNAPFDDSYFDHDQYQRLRPLISDTTRSYFDQLVSSASGELFKNHGFFIEKIRRPDLYETMNPYLRDDSSYHQASQNVRSMLFHPTNMLDFLDSVRPESYDVVYCSNISTYMDGGVNFMMHAVAALRLRPGGIIIDCGFVNGDADIDMIQSSLEYKAAALGLQIRHVVGDLPYGGSMKHGVYTGSKSIVSISEKAA